MGEKCKFFKIDFWKRKYLRILAILISQKKADEISLLWSFEQLYKCEYGQNPNLRHPKNLSEKLLWLSYYWRNPMKIVCADKLRCREFVTEQRGLPQNLLVPIYGSYNDIEEIDFNRLPQRFFLQCNHGCGFNYAVKDKSQLDIIFLKKQFDVWMKSDYCGNLTEIHYKGIAPHKIICAEYLPAIGNDSSVIDYKLHCFNGEPYFVLVCYDRDEKGRAKLATFSLQWEQAFYTNNEKESNLMMPKSLKKMIEYSRTLSQGFPFVRVDFYDIDGSPYLGEMTFTPAGNLPSYFSMDIQNRFGQILKLPSKYNVD